MANAYRSDKIPQHAKAIQFTVSCPNVNCPTEYSVDGPVDEIRATEWIRNQLGDDHAQHLSSHPDAFNIPYNFEI